VDCGLSLEDDVEPRTAEPLSQDPLPGVEPFLVERMGDRFELGPRQIAEQPEARERVGDFLSVQILTPFVIAADIGLGLNI
jgi:hypothetical protein